MVFVNFLGNSRFLDIQESSELLDFLQSSTELVNGDFYVTCNGSLNLPSHFEHMSTVHVVPRLRGGKGGFGSQLRAQAGRMNKKVSTNFDACRDLSGNRLKHIKEAKYLNEFLEKQAEQEKQKEEKIVKKIEEGLKEPAPVKIRFEDKDYEENYEKSISAVQASVARALLSKKITKSTIQRKGKASSAPGFDSLMEDLSSSDEESEPSTSKSS